MLKNLQVVFVCTVLLVTLYACFTFQSQNQFSSDDRSGRIKQVVLVVWKQLNVFISVLIACFKVHSVRFDCFQLWMITFPLPATAWQRLEFCSPFVRQNPVSTIRIILFQIQSICNHFNFLGEHAMAVVTYLIMHIVLFFGVLQVSS